MNISSLLTTNRVKLLGILHLDFGYIYIFFESFYVAKNFKMIFIFFFKTIITIITLIIITIRDMMMIIIIVIIITVFIRVIG